jgi:hypothetical protein
MAHLAAVIAEGFCDAHVTCTLREIDKLHTQIVAGHPESLGETGWLVACFARKLLMSSFGKVLVRGLVAASATPGISDRKIGKRENQNYEGENNAGNPYDVASECFSVSLRFHGSQLPLDDYTLILSV